VAKPLRDSLLVWRSHFCSTFSQKSEKLKKNKHHFKFSMANLVHFSGLKDLDDGLYNANIIRKLQCDDNSCSGSILAGERSNVAGTVTVDASKVLSVHPRSFSVLKSQNPNCYHSLKSFYDRSTIHETSPPNVNSFPAAAVLSCGLGAVAIAAILANK
jgi:hypothetical protein